MTAPCETMIARLKGLSPLTALAPSGVFPLGAPRGELPYCVYEWASTPVNHSAGDTGDRETAITLYWFAPTASAARALAAAAAGAGGNIPAGLSGWIDGDNRVWHLQGQREDAEMIMVGRDQREAFVVIQDYFV